MDAATREGMASSVKNDWGTPREVVDPLEAFGGIELDPCANLRSVIRPRKGIYLPDDGLVASWSDILMDVEDPLDLLYVSDTIRVGPNGLVFVNPPYGRAVKKWMEKCREEAEKGCEIVALVAARVDTKWFQDIIFGSAQALCFWKGRIKFIDLSTGAQGDPAFFPSAVVYWGPRTLRFMKAYEDKGQVIQLRG